MALKNSHLHHKNKRGIGGGKGDDRPETVTLLCPACHGKRHK